MSKQTAEQEAEIRFPFMNPQEGSDDYNSLMAIKRESFLEGVQYAGEWISEKPEFKEDCLLIAAHSDWNGEVNYVLYEIKGTEVNGMWYWEVFREGEAWGDIVDLTADKYLILSPPSK